MIYKEKIPKVNQMAVIAITNNPNELIQALYQGIRDHTITTWLVDDDGDITIARQIWRHKAWFSIKSNSSSVIFGIIPSMKHPMTKELYGVYHGRLAATILANFDEMIGNITLTSGYLEDYDVVQSILPPL